MYRRCTGRAPPAGRVGEGAGEQRRQSKMKENAMSSVLNLQRLEVEHATAPQFNVSWSSCDTNSCNG